jgi:hypothetical protein
LYSPPEDIDIIMMYIEASLFGKDMHEVMRKAVEMGYDVHGGAEGGRVEVPDITIFMEEIADDFAGYLEDNLPKLFTPIAGEENFMNEERLAGIVAEVRDHLLSSPPDFPAVLDMAGELGLPEAAREEMMKDFHNYMNKKIFEILEHIGFPREQRDEAAASMAYALGSLSDKDYFEIMGGVFGGDVNMDDVANFLSATYVLPDTDKISREIFEGVTNYLNDNLPSLGLGED